MKSRLRASAWLMLTLPGFAAQAADATIAVAANFAAPVEQLVEAFEQQTGHSLRVSSGSTGSLYTLITQGAPFDLLIAADQARPQRLIDEELAVRETRCTYAVGRLVLWSRDADRIGDDPKPALTDSALRHLAIANPDTAPYGAAAREVLTRLGVWTQLQSRLVRGMDIGQTYHMVATANAELGFVAASSLAAAGDEAGGSRWTVPDDLHTPLAQDAVLLKRGRDNAAAIGFLRYLGSENAQRSIRRFGYEIAADAACPS
ncbi:molybdate ABC transporter substrate-binding protein [Algiphilus sp. W345]|uniref:Molybdate ABC transporter substrate-binding protein n=1 Tax=Banduia mediterranea TaxID=3075609 RepID=A0ABU2WJN9_9GAMM|nr:molybdate ABC transporter substrate-binding protein [Algiphilus sp. W345]MDT0498090.1 molybdate ABC transporter substrate-binding protein [Algiphilus sp. W345]